MRWRVSLPGTTAYRRDGRLLFLEHVRSTDPNLAARQGRWHGLWVLFGAGCHCNRDSERAIAGAAFHIERITHGQMPKMLTIVQPLVTGVARPKNRRRRKGARMVLTGYTPASAGSGP